MPAEAEAAASKRIVAYRLDALVEAAFDEDEEDKALAVANTPGASSTDEAEASTKLLTHQFTQRTGLAAYALLVVIHLRSFGTLCV